MSIRKGASIILLITILLLFLRGSGLSQTLISLDFKDAEIRNIIRLIAEVSNQNIILGDEVTGKLILRISKISWDEALQAILQSQGLEAVRIGNIIRIGSAEKFRREVEARWFSKMANEMLRDLKTEVIRLKYASAKEMIPIVKVFLSERGKIMADERTNRLIIRDISENIDIIRGLFHQ